jgi:integration host factor subunit alpha
MLYSKISGFGVFEVREKKPRRGRNPQTGEELVLPTRRVVTFRPSRALRKDMSGSSV